MAATDTDSVHDHMTRLRMKMVQQKIQNEKEKIVNNRPQTEESNSNDMEQQARLQQAMLRRQELLDKIRREQLLNEESRRPRTYSPRRRYTPSPLPIPPSRRSLPDFARYNIYNHMPDTYRADMSQVKHVIEHKIATPKQQYQQYQLPPIKQAPPAVIHQPAPPVIHQPPQPQVVVHQPPQPYVMQSSMPQIIQGPPQHIIQQVPNPVIQNLGPPEKQSMFNKADFGEMMMMQNAQMHQMVMQKLMIGNLSDPHYGHGGGGGGHGCHDSCHGCQSGCCSSHNVHHGCGCHGGHSHGTVCYDTCLPAIPRPQGNVHHHHYSTPPQSQPAVHHYQTMPQMDMRGGYPGGGGNGMRGEYMSSYYEPYSYYEYYQ